MNIFIHSNLTQKFGRACVQAAGSLVTSAATVFLILAWLLTEPFFELSDRISRDKKLKQPIKGKL